MHGKIFLRNEKTAWENKKMLDSVGRVCYTVITSKRVYFFCAKIWPDSFPAKPF